MTPPCRSCHGPQPLSEAIAEQEQKQFPEQAGEEGEEKEEEQQGLAAGQQLSPKEEDLWLSRTQVELGSSQGRWGRLSLCFHISLGQVHRGEERVPDFSWCLSPLLVLFATFGLVLTNAELTWYTEHPGLNWAQRGIPGRKETRLGGE